jgi:hypothetical protein
MCGRFAHNTTRGARSMTCTASRAPLSSIGRRTGRDERSHSARYPTHYLGEADDRTHGLVVPGLFLLAIPPLIPDAGKLGNRHRKALAWEAPPAFRERYGGHEAGGSRGPRERNHK